MKKKFYLKTILVLVVAFFTAATANDLFFVENSPKVYPQLGKHISQRIKFKTQEFIATLPFYSALDRRSVTGDEAKKGVESIESALANAPLQVVSKGVYAKTDGVNKMEIINTGEADMVRYTFTSNGEPVVITIPKAYYDKMGMTEQQIREQFDSMK